MKVVLKGMLFEDFGRVFLISAEHQEDRILRGWQDEKVHSCGDIIELLCPPAPGPSVCVCVCVCVCTCARAAGSESSERKTF